MDVLQPYGHIKGFCYMQSTSYNNIAFWRDYDPKVIERDLGYAERLGLNSARVFLNYVVWEREPQALCERLVHFVRAAHDRGITTMPVVWDCCQGAPDTGAGLAELKPYYEYDDNEWVCNPGPHRFGPEFWPDGERYCADLVDALRNEPGLEMWDVMNEPLATTWPYVEGKLDEARVQVIWTFVRHFCDVFHKLDADHPITVGNMGAPWLEPAADHVDVLAFHDYSPTRTLLAEHIDTAVGIAEKSGKPILINETGSFSRINPYDMVIEVCNDKGIGYYFWELMIGVNRWSEIHGLVYPDGTVRDPGAVLATMGFFRKRDGKGGVVPKLDREARIRVTLASAQSWLGTTDSRYADGLDIAERMANIMEGGEIIPMAQLPTAKVMSLAGESPEHRAELARSIITWGELLKRYCEA